MIDLHSHTTASDGRLEPSALARAAWEAGVRVLAITDHDTTAALPVARQAFADYGLTLVNGIEMTAVDAGRDIHVLGYFFDPQSDSLVDFLLTQRAARLARVQAICDRLNAIGKPVDVEAVLREGAQPGRSIGRPTIARAMVEAGHVADARHAFDQWLTPDRPAWVPREGPSVEAVVAVLHDAGGVASLAHPGLYGRDEMLPTWADAGLDALEVFHSEHGPADNARYREFATRLGLAISGGSDYHGDEPGRVRARARVLGRISLPEPEYERLLMRVPGRRSGS